MRAGSLDLHSDTGERLDPAPPFGGAHNIDWEAREFLPVPQDGAPVPGAEEVATVDEGVAEEHPVARVGQALRGVNYFCLVLPRLRMLPDCLIECVPAETGTFVPCDRAASTGPHEGRVAPDVGWRGRPIARRPR